MPDTTHPAAARSWLGIPFAKADRFQRPVLLPFGSDRAYDQKGPAPLQAGDTSWLEADNGFSEDCLNLNVWAPEDGGDKPLPVIVYIYGGGFQLGANTQTTSNASGLAATGRAIGVSLNYRLGPFGWLSLSQYGGALKHATNLGLQDIIAALRWVRENIARFGGDPDNVTVTGHSAGAFCTLDLLAAPAADGLYHHLAAFSGMAARLVPAWGAEERTLAVLTKLGIQDNPEQLLNMDAMLLAETMSKTQPADPGAWHSIDNNFIAIVDDHTQPGGVLADHPLRVLESGRHRDVDILFSSTTHETDWWVLVVILVPRHMVYALALGAYVALDVARPRLRRCGGSARQHHGCENCRTRTNARNFTIPHARPPGFHPSPRSMRADRRQGQVTRCELGTRR